MENVRDKDEVKGGRVGYQHGLEIKLLSLEGLRVEK